jgi:hypothetical protein
MLDLVVFTTDADRAAAVMAGGAAAIFIDWEYQGKWERQRGADTEINQQSVEDLRRIRSAIAGTVICRVNALHEGTAQEVALALDNGADELLLPMVRSVDDAARFLSLVDGRARAGVLVETGEACQVAESLSALPLHRVYVGLNDLAIDRRRRSIFGSLADGTVDEVRRHFCTTHFGVGGVTLPNCGAPVPSPILTGEILRLRADFTFLRRSFWRDVGDSDPAEAIRSIQAFVQQTAMRSAEEVRQDHASFLEIARHLEES